VPALPQCRRCIAGGRSRDRGLATLQLGYGLVELTTSRTAAWTALGSNADDLVRVASVADQEYVRVGRWMSQAEYDAMLVANRVQESANLNGVTSVSSPPNAAAWMRQTNGTLYVEFDVPKSALSAGGFKIYGPNSFAAKARNITEMPPARNIQVTARK
jgi:hypothetical protein